MQTASLPIELPEDAPPPGIILKKIGARHKEAMALIAQGVDRRTVAKICNWTPEYITWLQQQPLCKEYLVEMNEVVGFRLEALFDKSVDVIAEAMVNGSQDERLKAARLQMEATKRLGKHEQQPETPDSDRLERLAERLIALQGRVRSGETFEGTSTDVTDVEVVREDANV